MLRASCVTPTTTKLSRSVIPLALGGRRSGKVYMSAQCSIIWNLHATRLLDMTLRCIDHCVSHPHLRISVKLNTATEFAFSGARNTWEANHNLFLGRSNSYGCSCFAVLKSKYHMLCQWHHFLYELVDIGFVFIFITHFSQLYYVM